MAVSYWGVGDQERAVALTQQGIQWIQFAVSEGYADEQILAVPYTNMATMLEFRGNSLEARQYQNHSARLTSQTPR